MLNITTKFERSPESSVKKAISGAIGSVKSGRRFSDTFFANNSRPVAVTSVHSISKNSTRDFASNGVQFKC